MIEESIDLTELVRILRLRSKMILSIIGGTMALFLIATFVLPKKYKSTASLTIYTKYFQNPLVKDFLPEIYDSSELKSQRETLIRKAFDTDFLNKIGEKYHLFKTARTNPQHSFEEFDLFKRIEVYSIENTTFSISFVGSNPIQTRDILNDIISRVSETLADERKKTTSRLRDSIRKRIELMALSMDNAADPLASVRPELLRDELNRLNAQINALKTQYTERHPMITKLVARAEVIKKWLARSSPNVPTGTDSNQVALVGGEPKDPTLGVYTDLLKKMNYLNIVLEMEEGATNAYVGLLQAPQLPESPVFPKKTVFLFWGLLTGIMISMMFLLSQEYIQRSLLSPEEFAKKLNYDYFGLIPSIQWKESSSTPISDGNKAEGPNAWN